MPCNRLQEGKKGDRQKSILVVNWSWIPTNQRDPHAANFLITASSNAVPADRTMPAPRHDDIRRDNTLPHGQLVSCPVSTLSLSSPLPLWPAAPGGFRGPLSRKQAKGTVLKRSRALISKEVQKLSRPRFCSVATPPCPQPPLRLRALLSPTLLRFQTRLLLQPCACEPCSTSYSAAPASPRPPFPSLPPSVMLETKAESLSWRG